MPPAPACRGHGSRLPGARPESGSRCRDPDPEAHFGPAPDAVEGGSVVDGVGSAPGGRPDPRNRVLAGAPIHGRRVPLRRHAPGPALRQGPVPAAKAVSAIAELADALAALHEKGFLLGDIKPSNIGFTSSGTPKLLDLGAARSTDDPVLAGGTLPYVSPTRWRSGSAASTSLALVRCRRGRGTPWHSPRRSAESAGGHRPRFFRPACPVLVSQSSSGYVACSIAKRGPKKVADRIVRRFQLALARKEALEPQASCPGDSSPTASISAAVSPLTEGTGASFTATPDSAGLKALTVLVGVTEDGASGCRSGQAWDGSPRD